MFGRATIVAGTLTFVCAVVAGCGGEDASDGIAVSGTGGDVATAGMGGVPAGAGGATGPAGTAGMMLGAGGLLGGGGDLGLGGSPGSAGMMLGAGGLLGGGGDLGAAGVGGALGAGGLLGAGGDFGAGGRPPDDGVDLGVGDGQDVVLIGDSWMNLGSVGIQQSVVKASGGRPYRTLGVSGTRMLNGQIPGQYAAAKAADPDIKTLIVTGGGNDVLQDPLVLVDCFNVGPTCQAQLDQVGDVFEEMSQEALADGVEDVIIIMYTRNTLLGAPIVDYVWETMTDTCTNGPVRCYMIDPDEVAGGLMETRDGIHPTDAGYDQLGEAVYQLMVQEGMRR